jgi:hypothetical protein
LPPTIPYNFFPVFESSVLLGKEGATTPGTAATAFTAIPAMALQVSNKVMPLMDEALRGSNVKSYDLQLGPRHAEITFPESPCYGDTIGMPLLGLMGDLTTTGTAGTPTWTTSGALSPGAGPIAVTSGSSAVAGTYVQIDTTTTAEVVKVGTGSTATSIVVDASTPIRFSHNTGVAVTTVTAPFTHTLSNLNPGSSTGNSSAHPPTYTTLHRNLIPGSGNFNADQYLYTNFSGVKFQAKKDGWFVWDGKATARTRTYPTADFPPSFTSVRGMPSWKSAISLASSSVYNISELTVDIQREIDIITTADGVEDPYALGAGPLTATFTADFDAITSEAELDYMLNNTQPTLSWQISNGLSGASLVSFTVNAQLAAFKGSDLTAVKTQWGWKTSGELIASTSDAGNSGGYSPLQVVLQNAIPTY